MRILGIRTAPQQIRYAIVESTNGVCSLLNENSENIIRKPVGITETHNHLKWIKEELHRIIRQNTNLDVIALKVPEFAGSRTASARNGDYLDAIVLLVAAEVNLPVITKLYSQMATKRTDVTRQAEDRVGRTSTGWNEQMADAVAVAWIAQR